MQKELGFGIPCKVRNFAEGNTIFAQAMDLIGCSANIRHLDTSSISLRACIGDIPL